MVREGGWTMVLSVEIVSSRFGIPFEGRVDKTNDNLDVKREVSRRPRFFFQITIGYSTILEEEGGWWMVVQ